MCRQVLYPDTSVAGEPILWHAAQQDQLTVILKHQTVPQQQMQFRNSPSMRHGNAAIPCCPHMRPGSRAAFPTFIEGIPALHLLVFQVDSQRSVTSLTVACKQALVCCRKRKISPATRLLRSY